MNPDVLVTEVKAALDSGRGVVVDVRQKYEFDAGHIPGAVFLPLAVLPLRAQELPTDRTLYIICASGARSWQACRFLAASGREAHNVAGGMAAWMAAGLPVERG